MKLVRCAKTGNIVSGAAFFILGVILVIFPKTSLILLSRVAGAVMLASGIIRILGYFSKDLYYLAFQFDFALGILSVLFGAIFFFKPTAVISAIQVLMGVFVLINGLFALQTAMDSKKFGMKFWWVLLIFSVLSSVFGLALIVNPFSTASAIAKMIGMTLLFVGAEKVFVSIYTIVTKKGKSGETNSPVDLSDFKDYTERAE